MEEVEGAVVVVAVVEGVTGEDVEEVAASEGAVEEVLEEVDKEERERVASKEEPR